MRFGIPFLAGHILAAMIIGAVGGVLINTNSIVSFTVLMGLGALASGAMCNWLPGYDAPGWQLWLAGAFTNPLLLVAISFTTDAADCVIGKAKGPSCLFGDIGPLVIGVCLVPPLVGLAARWILSPAPVPEVPPMPQRILDPPLVPRSESRPDSMQGPSSGAASGPVSGPRTEQPPRPTPPVRPTPPPLRSDDL